MEDSTDGTPIMCSRSSASPYTTTIMFMDKFGPLPPIAVHFNNTGASRMFPSGGDHLSLSLSTPVLRIATYQQIVCPVCASCTGTVHFVYGDSISSGVDITSTSANSKVATAIDSLTDLMNENWPALSISVNAAQTSLCSTTTEAVTKITFYSTTGPLPPLGLLDQTYVDTSTYGYDYHVNLTMTHDTGSDILYECSNQGICDRTTGLCQCFYTSDDEGTAVYEAFSSNGKGGKGTRGDCGYIETSVSSCYDKGKRLICSGHGVCFNTSSSGSGSCSCYDGWAGILCQVSTSCPHGPAFADQPISSTEAHQMAECSNMGLCNRRTGECVCRVGFTGDACQYRDCPRDGTSGATCSGNGRCMSISELYDMYGLTYGSIWNNRIYPEVHIIHMITVGCAAL
jgi:hypothetical protein